MNLYQTKIYLKKLLKIYNEDKSIVYTHVKNYIIFLKKLNDTITNEMRNNVVNPLFALFRGDKFKVCLILHKDYNNIPKYIKNITDYKKNIIFIIDEIVTCNFDKNLDNVYGDGIHYIKNFHSLCNSFSVNTGYQIEYYENGMKFYEGFYRNNKKNGLHIMYRRNGKKFYDTMYIDGKKNGISTSYNENGDITFEGTYKNNKMNGLWKELPYNTQNNDNMNVGNYINNNKNGIWTEYINNEKYMADYD